MNIVIANLAPQFIQDKYKEADRRSRFETLHFPLGLGSIAAILNKAGRRFTVYDSYVDEEAYCANLGPVYDKPYLNVSNLSDDDLIKAKDILMHAAMSQVKLYSS